MQKTLFTISSLLLSIAILLTGNGLLGTLLTLRGAAETYSESTIGTIMSLYFAGFMVGTFLCPKLIRRVGHIRTFTVMAAVGSCSTIVYGLWIDPYVWAVARLLTGICMVGVYMVIESWLNEQSTNQIRGRVFASYMLVMLFFLATGQFLILAADITTMTLFAICAGLFSFSLVPVALTRLPEPAPISAIELDMKKLFRTSPLGFTGCLVAGLLGSSFWALGPLFAQKNALSELGIAAFMSATILGGACLQYPIGIWSDHTDRRRILMYITFISAAAAAIAIFIPADYPYLLALCMFVYGGMMFSIYPVSVAHTNDHMEANEMVATSSNLLLVNGTGAAIGPLLGGILMQSFGRYSLLVSFVIIGLTLSIYALHQRRYGVKIMEEDKTAFVPISRTSQVALEGIVPVETETDSANGKVEQ